MAEMVVGLAGNIQVSQGEIHPFLYGDEDCAVVKKVTAESVQGSEKAICQIIIIANISSNNEASVVIHIHYFLLCPAKFHISIYKEYENGQTFFMVRR